MSDTTTELRQLADINRAYAELGPRARTALYTLALRLRAGTTYGDFEGRDWHEEAAQEALDLAVYLMVFLQQPDSFPESEFHAGIPAGVLNRRDTLRYGPYGPSAPMHGQPACTCNTRGVCNLHPGMGNLTPDERNTLGQVRKQQMKEVFDSDFFGPSA